MKIDKIQQQKDYVENKVIDCPWCNLDKPDHSCKNCRSEITEEECFQFKGYCRQKCVDNIEVDLPKIRELKNNLGIECKCDEPYCGKCLSAGCTDNNCLTHTNEAKADWHNRNKNKK